MKSLSKSLPKSRSILNLKHQNVRYFSYNVATDDLRKSGKHYPGGYYQTGHRMDGFNDPKNPRILITGASGQIGTELIVTLRKKYGTDNVVASDVKINKSLLTSNNASNDGPFVFLDVCDYNGIARICMEYQIDWIFHMAALLSAVGERDPKLAIKINNTGVENILEVSRLNDIRAYIPSSIAVFGKNTQKVLTPNETLMRPNTIYGITKVYSELLGEYYHNKFGVDYRSIRYPGIISSQTMPGGGTTDYAVEIYHDALTRKYYKCFLAKDTILPMMYMDDCIDGTINLMEANDNDLKHRVYNIAGMSFTPEQQANSIKKYLNDFEIEYKPDFRQEIAETWPHSIDDSEAQNDWNWKPKFDLDSMTVTMLETLGKKYGVDFEEDVKKTL